MKHTILAIALLFSSVVATQATGCGAVLAALPVIIAAADTASDVIAAIESFVSSKDAMTPAIEKAIQAARFALADIRSAAKGAKSIDDGDLHAALDAFEPIYKHLTDLVGGLGVQADGADGRMSASSTGGLRVPSASALRAELSGK